MTKEILIEVTMLNTISSDQLFLTFMISLVISLLLITSGVGVVLPQKYNSIYRKDQRDNNIHDIVNVFTKGRSERNKKPGFWNYIVSLSIIITVFTFMIFIYKEFVL